MILKRTINWPTHQVRHICKAHKADTQSQPCKRACLVATLPRHTLPRWTQTFNSSYQDEGRTHNIGFAKLGLDNETSAVKRYSSSVNGRRRILIRLPHFATLLVGQPGFRSYIKSRYFWLDRPGDEVLNTPTSQSQGR